MLENVFKPGKIGSLELKNRFVVPPMVTMYTTEDGRTTDQFINYYTEKAKGGFGLIITENYAIMSGAGGFTKMGHMWDDSHVEDHKKLVDSIHNAGSKVALQIYHAGRETTRAISGKEPVAPSAIKDPTMPEVPKELSKSEIKEIVDAFANSALKGKKAGFDAVEIHGAHGYLINQFMSPFSNKRTDEYGGTVMNRMRFALEIIEAVREKVGPDFPLLFRVSAEELVEGGLTIEDTKVICKIVEDAGIDAIDISVGVYASRYMIAAPAAKSQGWMVEYSREIKKIVDIPVIIVNRITDPFMADNIVASGDSDFIALGRASIADPHFPRKAKEGRFDEIRKCIGCMQGCIGRQVQGLNVACLVNPVTGNEDLKDLPKTKSPKKVFVAGGGPAGMQAAISAAETGHDVSLFEKTSKLGGQWLLAAVPPNKEELNTLTVWQKKELKRLGVKICMETELDEEILKAEKPDALITATGAVPIIPEIKGIENVVTADSVLAGEVEPGEKVVVVGGGLVGAETAEHLAVHWKKVTLVEMQPEIVPDLEEGPRVFLTRSLKEHNAEVLTNTHVKEIRKNSVVVETNRSEREIEADTIIIAIGSKSVNSLSEKAETIVDKVVTIGDALHVGRALEGIQAGFKVGMEI